MTRSAKLFYLNHKEINTLKEAVVSHDDHTLKYRFIRLMLIITDT